MRSKKKPPTAATRESSDLPSRMVGKWSGSASTWLEPGSPPKIEKIAGIIRPLVGSRAVTHTYRTRLNGAAAPGVALIGKDIGTERLCISWVDIFHTGANMMTLHGDDRQLKAGFSVMGAFSVGPGAPPWGWRVTYQLKKPDALEIIHYCIKPDGHESVAIKIAYKKVKAAGA